MGKRKFHGPRRGSLGYRRIRAETPKAKVRGWTKYSGAPRLEGFVGFKAGMTHILTVEDRKFSHRFSSISSTPVTILEAPPLVIIGLRAYRDTAYGLQILGELYAENVADSIRKRSKNHPKHQDFEEKKRIMDEYVDIADEIRAIVSTQPELINIGRKIPDILELKIGCGDLNEGYQWALERFGQEVLPENVFKAGDVTDAISVTKGKGFQGPVKRHGIKILQHKSKHTKRGVGSIGPWHPARVMWTVPRAGNMGFERRTEYNKRIMQIGDFGQEVTPRGDFIGYGKVHGRYIMVKGSLPGAKKRLVVLRHCIREHKFPESAPRINYISQESQM